jgi:hypothetical protein
MIPSLATFARPQTSGVVDGRSYFDLPCAIDWSGRLRVLDPLRRRWQLLTCRRL